METLEKTPATMDALGVRHIDSFVRTVARKAHNTDQMNRLVTSVVGDTGLLFSKVKELIAQRHAEGAYDEVLASPRDFREKASVARNLQRIGIIL